MCEYVFLPFDRGHDDGDDHHRRRRLATVLWWSYSMVFLQPISKLKMVRISEFERKSGNKLPRCSHIPLNHVSLEPLPLESIFIE